MELWNSISCWADAAPMRRALGGLTYRGLKGAIIRCLASLPDLEGQRVGLFMGNRPLWGVYDMALTLKGAVVVPLPTFFSREQLAHIMADAGIETVVVPSKALLESRGLLPLMEGVTLIEADPALEEEQGKSGEEPAPLLPSDPDRIAKIIYTSGTTGRPKGVAVRLGGIEAVTRSLVARSGANMGDRHLSLLPLSTLVEAIGGLYAPLTAGGTVLYPSTGSPEEILFNPGGLVKALADASPTTLNLVPSLLGVILSGVQHRYELPLSLRFVAVGGAPLHPGLVEKAERLGLPLYQGYGLSECSSVVALNGPGANKAGSVGRILDHAAVEIAPDGEIIVSGMGVMAGYTHSQESPPERIATGDLGRIDEEGYLYVTGRKDNLILTNQGRNVSPEWVESVLNRSGVVRQVLVYGNTAGEISAVVVPHSDWLSRHRERLMRGEACDLDAAMAEALERGSETLPPYARVKHFTLTEIPFTIQNGLMGSDGRLNRKTILARFEGSEQEERAAAAQTI